MRGDEEVRLLQSPEEKSQAFWGWAYREGMLLQAIVYVNKRV